MKTFNAILLAALTTLTAVSTGRAQAVTIIAPNTYNTGQNNGSLIAPGSADASWQFVSFNNAYNLSNPITYTPGSSVVQTGNPAPPWVANTGTAQWIGAVTPASSFDGGIYTYQFTFTAATAGIATISGTWAVDNVGSITLTNGTPVGGTGTTLGTPLTPTPGSITSPNANSGPIEYSSLTSFSFTTPVSVGSNTIDFVDGNFNDNGGTPPAGNPGNAGIIVSDFGITESAAPVPEPGQYAMIFLGAGFALMVGRKIQRRFLIES